MIESILKQNIWQRLISVIYKELLKLSEQAIQLKTGQKYEKTYHRGGNTDGK
jgi:hypothetical protein